MAAPPSVWEWCDDHRQWVEFDDALSGSLEHAYNTDNPSMTYTTSIGNSGLLFFSVDFFKYDGWKIDASGVAIPLRRLNPPPMTAYSSIWEFWASNTSNWSRFPPSSSVEIETKWQETERSKLFNQPNGLAGFFLTENNTTCTIVFATEGLQTNLTTNFIRGVRRRYGPRVTRSVPQGNPAPFHHPPPLNLSIFQSVPIYSSNPFNRSSHSVFPLPNAPPRPSPFGTPVFSGFQSPAPSGLNTFPPGISLFGNPSPPSIFSGYNPAGYNPADLIPITLPEKDRDCSICTESLSGNDNDDDGATQATAAAATGSATVPDSGASTTAIATTTNASSSNSGSPLSDSKVVKLSRCKHYYHRECIKKWFEQKPVCPECMMKYGVVTGTQPTSGASMKVLYHPYDPSYGWAIDGYPNTDVIEITYEFQSGVQGPEHPNPGTMYRGTVRTAYLPQNSEGEQVLRLLKEAWNRRLIFRVGRSISSGQDNCVVWGGIHHKTSMRGGSASHGYPDPTYFSRVKQELRALGVD